MAAGSSDRSKWLGAVAGGGRRGERVKWQLLRAERNCTGDSRRLTVMDVFLGSSKVLETTSVRSGAATAVTDSARRRPAGGGRGAARGCERGVELRRGAAPGAEGAADHRQHAAATWGHLRAAPAAAGPRRRHLRAQAAACDRGAALRVGARNRCCLARRGPRRPAARDPPLPRWPGALCIRPGSSLPAAAGCSAADRRASAAGMARRPPSPPRAGPAHAGLPARRIPTSSPGGAPGSCGGGLVGESLATLVACYVPRLLQRWDV